MFHHIMYNQSILNLIHLAPQHYLPIISYKYQVHPNPKKNRIKKKKISLKNNDNKQ